MTAPFFFFFFFSLPHSGHQPNSTAHPRHSERWAEQASQRLLERPQHSTTATDLRVQQPTSLTTSHLSSHGGEGCGGCAVNNACLKFKKKKGKKITVFKRKELQKRIWNAFQCCNYRDERALAFAGKSGRGSHIKLSGLLSSRRFTFYVKHWVVQAVGHWSALSWQDLLPKDNLSGEWAVTSA